MCQCCPCRDHEGSKQHNGGTATLILMQDKTSSQLQAPVSLPQYPVRFKSVPVNFKHRSLYRRTLYVLNQYQCICGFVNSKTVSDFPAKWKVSCRSRSSNPESSSQCLNQYTFWAFMASCRTYDKSQHNSVLRRKPNEGNKIHQCKTSGCNYHKHEKENYILVVAVKVAHWRITYLYYVF